jgi:hypothetical protein
MSRSLAALLAAQPALLGVGTAGTLLGLPPRTLLHAGPPLRNPRQPPPVLLSSAVMLCLHEGWAHGMAEAETLVRDGGLTWEPAQSRACVVPLAHLVSATTPLLEVGDGLAASTFAPLSTVRGTDVRMGCREPTLLARLAERDQRIAPALARVLLQQGRLPLLPLAVQGLGGGDDLHSRTVEANAALAQWLLAAGDPALAADVADTPLFFLTLWMAACAFMLRCAEPATDLPTLVTRAGGNGESFGICCAGQPGLWSMAVAQAPSGHLLSTASVHMQVCPAIGDSAVIDVLGLGAQTLATAPEPLQAFADFLPPGYAGLAEQLMAKMHPVLERRVGLDARRVLAQASTPLVALAMLAADGQGGLLGRGLYRPPAAVFAR